MNALRNVGWARPCSSVSLRVGSHPPAEGRVNYEKAREALRLPLRALFKTYTEKSGRAVSEMPPTGRRSGSRTSTAQAVVNAILPKRGQTDITTLIEEFQYPKYGPHDVGARRRRCRRRRDLEMGGRLTRIHVEGGERVRDVHQGGPSTRSRSHWCHHAIASWSIRSRASAAEVVAPPTTALRDYSGGARRPSRAASRQLIYIHATTSRWPIQNYGSWAYSSRTGAPASPGVLRLRGDTCGTSPTTSSSASGPRS